MAGAQLRSRPIDDRSREPNPERRRRRRTWRTWVVLGGIVTVVAALVWAVAWSPLLGVRQVSVRGTLYYLTRSDVLRVAAVPHGQPLVRLDTEAITQRVESLPEVATAQVSVSYPSTVVIRLTERVAVGYVMDGTEVHLVDRTGRQFRTVASVPPGVPELQVGNGPRAQASAAAAATAASALPASILARLASIQADDPAGISLLLRDQRIVRWGGPERSADKARVLVALLGRPGTLFDVSNPDLVYTR